MTGLIELDSVRMVWLLLLWWWALALWCFSAASATKTKGEAKRIDARRSAENFATHDRGCKPVRT